MDHDRQQGDLLIRPWRAGDAPGLHRAVRASLTVMSEWLPWAHGGYGLREAEAWVAYSLGAWADGTAFPMAIVNARTGEILGGTGFSDVDRANATANLGYWVSARHHGQGIATRAAALAADIGFTDLALRRIEVRVLPGNAASLRVAHKLGARPEGLARASVRHGEAWVDAEVFALERG
jgi:RimJ/RimL family protein N-acetyltransferase